MKFHKNKLLTAVAAATLVLAVGACSSNGDDDEASLVNGAPVNGAPVNGAPVNGAPVNGAPVNGAPPALTELETVQADAVTAAAAAATAATAAKTASDAALAARENRAVIQTGDLSGGNSGMLAHAAYTHAKTAADAATAAQEASDAAAVATDASAATRALVMAETARDNAVTGQGMAEAQRDAAVLAAASEVKIVDKTKTVGDTSITVGVDDTREVTTVDATTRTGKEDDIVIMSKAVDGRDGIPAEAATENPTMAAVAAITEKPTVAAGREIKIGFVYDAADDSARVALVHSYIGTTTVGAYFDDDGTPITAGVGGLDDDSDDETPLLPIKAAKGTFYEAEMGLDASGMIETTTTKGISLYYYETPDANDVTVTIKNFLKRTNTGKDDADVVTYTYQPVTTATGVSLPEATEYAHHHYGIWADLEEAAKTGDNALATLGVGFVAGLSEMTGDDMPNHGRADYSGGWIGHVQAADPEGNGPIEMATGDSSMEALFEKGTVSVVMDGLANLAGTIDGNLFSGDKAPTAVRHDSLTEDGEFTGSFSGAFFGPKAKEAGGVFDYSSEDNEDGAFRGAFGGVR